MEVAAEKLQIRKHESPTQQHRMIWGTTVISDCQNLICLFLSLSGRLCPVWRISLNVFLWYRKTKGQPMNIHTGLSLTVTINSRSKSLFNNKSFATACKLWQHYINIYRQSFVMQSNIVNDGSSVTHLPSFFQYDFPFIILQIHGLYCFLWGWRILTTGFLWKHQIYIPYLKRCSTDFKSNHRLWLNPPSE